MSSSNRTTSKGGKGTKPEGGGKSHAGKSEGGGGKHKPAAQNVKMAQMDMKSEGPEIKDKVRQAIEMTRRPEEEVCLVLHDCDYDLNRAVNVLLEGSCQGEWETSVKKKKNRQASTSKTEPNAANAAAAPNTEAAPVVEDWDASAATNNTAQAPAAAQAAPDRDRSRTRGGGPPRMRARGDSRGWRGREGRDGGRENRDNRDGGPEEGGRGGEGGFRRGGRMQNGPGRGGRGGGAGRGGRRGYQGPRGSGGQSRSSGSYNSQPPIESWDSEFVASNTQNQDRKMGIENWDDTFPQPEDWDNEEYTGSLTETKVFTPSTANEGGDSVQPTAEQQQLQQQQQQQQQQPMMVPDMEPPTQANMGLSIASMSAGLAAALDKDMMPGVSSTTLTAAQSQYLSQLTAQSQQKDREQMQTGYQDSNSAYGTSLVNSYTSTNYNSGSGGYNQNSVNVSQQQDQTTQLSSNQQPQRKTQRARVPPPSKIPSTAVEMPGGDVSSGIGFLDVQFGGLDLVTDTTAALESTNSVVEPSVVPSNVHVAAPAPSAASVSDGYVVQSKQQVQTAPSATQSSAVTTGVQSGGGGGGGGVPPSVQAQNALAQSQMLSNTDSGTSQPSSGNEHLSGYSSTRVTDLVSKSSAVSDGLGASFQTFQKSTAAYQPPSVYNTSSYSSNAQVTSSNSYPSNQQTSSNSFSNSNNSIYNNTSSQYQPNSYSTGFASSITGPSYPTSYGNSASYAVPFNNYTPVSNHKSTGSKDNSQYDSTPTSTVSVSSTQLAGLTGNSQSVTTVANTKVSSASTAKGNVLTSIPPGVAPMMGTQYIMGQAGMPFYQQPMYSYEEIQMMSQRIPHMTAGYYDMGGYQTPTSLSTSARDGLAYAAAAAAGDGRFTGRAEHNASPVTQQPAPQQTAGSGAAAQPMPPPAYAYFYGMGTVPAGSFQYGTPAIYPQINAAAAAAAHSSTGSSQYGGKPGAGGYGAGGASAGTGQGTTPYGAAVTGAAYEQQDYSKTAYGQPQGKAGGAGAGSAVTTTGAAELMYAKSHVALGKVNSYEKQGFHSGTPPPFNLASSQSTAGLAASGQYAATHHHLFIPTMPPHQTHHNTQLMHQPLHQDSSNSSGGQRTQSSSQAKASGTKQTYQTSYWNPA